VLVQGASVGATGCVAAGVAGYYGGAGPAMFLAIIAGLVGAALAGLLFEAVLPRLIVQVRGGFVRSAVTRFGFSLGPEEWFHRPIFSDRVKRALKHQRGSAKFLDEDERDWFTGLQTASSVGSV
jgi:hypothetical protein